MFQGEPMRTCAIALLFAGFAALPAVAAASPQDGDDLFDPTLLEGSQNPAPHAGRQHVFLVGFRHAAEPGSAIRKKIVSNEVFDGVHGSDFVFALVVEQVASDSSAVINRAGSDSSKTNSAAVTRLMPRRRLIMAASCQSKYNSKRSSS